MKLNLPSTWTQKKIQALFCLCLLNLSQVSGGENFKQCLGIDKFYNPVVDFTNAITDKQQFCCFAGTKKCELMKPTRSGNMCGQCSTIGQSKFCITTGDDGSNSLNSLPNLPDELCGGIIGDTPSANSVVGKCPSLEAVGNTLDNQNTVSNYFSWLCCDANSCTVPANVQLLNNKIVTAQTKCATGQWSMMCFLDNGGWNCAGNISPNIDDMAQSMGSCVLQVVTPKSPTSSPSVSTTNGTPTSSGSSTPSPNSPNGSGGGNDNNKKTTTITLATVIPMLILLFGVLVFLFGPAQLRRGGMIREWFTSCLNRNREVPTDQLNNSSNIGLNTLGTSNPSTQTFSTT